MEEDVASAFAGDPSKATGDREVETAISQVLVVQQLETRVIPMPEGIYMSRRCDSTGFHQHIVQVVRIMAWYPYYARLPGTS